MSIQITSLNSGSNGNCYYIGNETEAVLVDMGLSCRELELRMGRLGLDLGRVRAVFISHEHSDHISGLRNFLKKYHLPVYITPATLRSGKLRFEASLINNFLAYHPVNIGRLQVTAFPKFHDACDPHSFMISDGLVNIGVFTDIGQVCGPLIGYFSRCHAAFLESNYDELMLSQGRYPWFLKQRITNGKGHLSNAQALALFRDYRPEYMTHLLLSHLSHENNSAELVASMFNEHAGNTKITIASRHQETPIFSIVAKPGSAMALPYWTPQESLPDMPPAKTSRNQFAHGVDDLVEEAVRLAVVPTPPSAQLKLF